MKMTPPNDAFAAGMVHWSESELKLTPSLDRRQFSLLPPCLGRKLLEIGAGGGRIAVLVAGAGCHDQLVAVEPSPHFLRLLQSGAGKAPKTTLMETEAEKLLPEYREHFDSVYSVHVLEHIEHDRQLLETTLELTRPGGNVILLVPALPFLFSEMDSQYPPLPEKMVRALVPDLTVEITHMAYNNLPGVLGSLYFSKFKKINYQKIAAKKEYFGVWHFFSEYVVPVIRMFERFVPVPIGLNLTIVLRKPAAPGSTGCRQYPGSLNVVN